MFRSGAGFVLLGGWLLSSCTDPPAGTADGGVDADSGVIVGGVCPNLPINTAPVIMDSVLNMPYPGMTSAMGGAIETGTYHEIAHIYYQPVMNPGHSWQATISVDGANRLAWSNVSRDALVFQQTSETYSVAGSEISITLLCPAILSGTNTNFRYTFTAGTLTFYSDADQTATVFQKQ